MSSVLITGSNRGIGRIPIGNASPAVLAARRTAPDDVAFIRAAG